MALPGDGYPIDGAVSATDAALAATLAARAISPGPHIKANINLSKNLIRTMFDSNKSLSAVPIVFCFLDLIMRCNYFLWMS